MKPYYSKDGIKIYHGDCREVLPSFAPGSFDLVLTDPPYGVGFEYGNYSDTHENFTSIILPVLRECAQSNDCGIFMSMAHMQDLPRAKWAACWHKPGSVRRSRIGGWSIWEPIFLYGDGWSFANDAITLPDCVNHSRGNSHPCPKPERLFVWLLEHHSAETILDPFMGSGTTLVAAKQLGRKCVGIEIEERYCEIAARRLDQKILAFPRDEAPKETQAEMFAETTN